MTDHPHFCDADCCLNRGGGVTIASLPPRVASATLKEREAWARQRLHMLTKKRAERERKRAT